jgi:formate-dependent phosphoribosylglycinamide formyltransferase (GAR transformylase)
LFKNHNPTLFCAPIITDKNAVIIWKAATSTSEKDLEAEDMAGKVTEALGGRFFGSNFS